MQPIGYELRVFIASPGDCEAERSVVRNVAERFNATLGHSGFRLRTTGWEGVNPDFGRPQSLINPLVDECDIFIGVLNRRLGSPTGTHESGFVEEFERALQRRRSSGTSPHVAVFFKQVPAELVRDAGPELTRVIAFQKRLEQERLALYSTFASEADLTMQLWSLLSERVHSSDIFSEPREQSPSDETQSSSQGSSVNPYGSESDLDGAQIEMAATLDSVSDIVKGREPRGELDLDRLLLIGLAANTTRSSIPTHVANRLFLRRDDLSLSRMEHDIWLRTVLEDIGNSTPESRTIPGWAILTQEEPDLAWLEEALPPFLKDNADGVVRGALRLLRDMNLRPPALWAHGETSGTASGPAMWAAMLQRSGTRRDASQYIFRVANADDTELFRAVLQEHDESDVQQLTDYYLGDPDPLCRSLAQSLVPAYKLEMGLLALQAASDKAVSEVLTGQRTGDVARRAALIELSSRPRALSPDDVIVALSHADLVEEFIVCLDDDTSAVDVDFVMSVLESEAIPSPQRSELFDRLRSRQTDLDDLLESLDAGQGALSAWDALQWRREESLVPIAREVLDTGGESVTGAIESSPNWKDELTSFVRGKARMGALRVLLSQDQVSHEDRLRARAELGGEYRLLLSELVTLYLPHADASDVSLLLARLGDIFGEARHQATARVLELGGLDAARALIDRGDRDQASSAVSYLVERAEEDAAVELMHSDESHIRYAAATAYCSRFGHEGAIPLLDRYPSMRSSFYYNVVVALDEFVCLNGRNG